METSQLTISLVMVLVSLSLMNTSQGQFIDNSVCEGRCFCNADASLVECNRGDRLGGIPGTLPQGYTKLHIKNGYFRNPILVRRNLTNLSQLVSLKVIYCGLEQIREQAFIDMKSLRYLDLSHNKIKLIADFTFYHLQLTELHLQENTGLKINRNSFQGVSTNELNLRSNGIKILNYDTFAKIGLTKLFLFNNSIRVVDPRFQNIFNKKPKVLDLSSNPIHCTCKLAWLHRLVMADSEGYKNIEITCASPPQFAGKMIETLNPRVFTCPSPKIESVSLDVWPTWAQLVCTATGAAAPGLSWTYQEGSTVKTVRQLPKSEANSVETGALVKSALAFNVSVTPVRRSYNCTTWGDTSDAEQSIVVHIRGPPAVDLSISPTQEPSSLVPKNNLDPVDGGKEDSSSKERGQNSVTKQHFIFRKQFTLLEMIGAVVGTFTITLAALLIISRVVKAVKAQREKKKTYWSTPGSAYSATGSHEYDVPRLDLHTATYNSQRAPYHTYNPGPGPDEMNFLDFKTQQKIYNR